MRILQLASCRGWSSDAYWAARVGRELARRGHEVTLGCRRGTEEKVIARARAEGLERVVVFEFASGVNPVADARDLRRLRTWLKHVDVVHVHRGKEHWLAAAANRVSSTPRPLIRTRHIVQAVRPHAANRWLYRRATALVVTVSEAIRAQYVCSGLIPAERVVALPGGADIARYRPIRPEPEMRGRLGASGTRPLVGLISGLRAMKGHHVLIDAAARLAALGLRPAFTLIGHGPNEAAVRDAVRQRGLERQFTFAGFVEDLPEAMAALDIALYVPLESDGMSRVVFEYLAAGRPLIAARVGVVPEVLVDSEHALLIPAGDPEALARALRRLIDEPRLGAKLGESARRLVTERYSGAAIAASLETRYAALTSA